MKTLFTSIILVFALIFPLQTYAQVGIGTSNPDQELDVNGKIKIGTDGKTPTDGTMRYNPTTGDFEGYANSNWQSMTTNGNALPSNPVPIFAEAATVSIGTTLDWQTFRSWTGTTYTSVPSGKFLIITSLYPSRNFFSGTDQYYSVSVTARTSSGTFKQGSTIRLEGTLRNTYPLNSGQSPLFILGPGEFLRFQNSSNSESNIDVEIRGFLVDDLDY